MKSAITSALTATLVIAPIPAKAESTLGSVAGNEALRTFRDQEAQSDAQDQAAKAMASNPTIGSLLAVFERHTNDRPC